MGAGWRSDALQWQEMSTHSQGWGGGGWYLEAEGWKISQGLLFSLGSFLLGCCGMEPIEGCFLS